ncbi:N-acetylneuraminate synthase family protein [Catalinimonas niigatensis]|uniref:N-acetylneuraminate synthase family protein n=1 Tax=Catalinimonas niigatensis TaxID=1397264 RepID=UPI0026668C12|nr:N-acetylneuraminate synthase family protein [Catalinimonas niigatensis]WPP50490.1 N-acetylneuraminate synthase family protein [Catalinimonas niigatensis]
MKHPWKGKYGPLLIAEIGGNHEGNFDYALKLTDLAIESGADYIKYQLYSGDSLVSRLEGAQRNAHFKKFELSQEQFIKLANRCKAAHVGFMASVWNPDYLDWIDEHMSIYKIGSGDLTAYSVIREIAKRGKPMILSTGLATLQEVLETVAFIQSLDDRYKEPDFLSILQCTSMYPIEFKDANLAVMHLLRQATQLPVGYSDHTEGYRALEIAAAMGAEILEFHFTDEREGKSFRDHKVSLTKDEVLALGKKIEEIRSLEGHYLKRPLEVEAEHRVSFRRAVYPSRDLTAGTVIKAEDLVSLRPNHGIDARDFDQLIGKKLKTDVQAHQKLAWEFFEA